MADITQDIDNIRKAIYGKEVRESIASSIQDINNDVESTATRQTELEEKWNSEGNQGEVIGIRTDKEGFIYDSAGDSVRSQNNLIKNTLVRGELYIEPLIKTINENYYISSKTGAEIANNSYGVSNTIDVSNISVFVATEGIAQFAYYKEDGSFLSGVTIDILDRPIQFEVPENAKIVKFTIDKSNIKANVFNCTLDNYCNFINSNASNILDIPLRQIPFETIIGKYVNYTSGNIAVLSNYKYDSYNIVENKTYFINTDIEGVQICVKDSNGNYLFGTGETNVIYEAPSNCIMYVSYPKDHNVDLMEGKSSEITIKDKYLCNILDIPLRQIPFETIIGKYVNYTSGNIAAFSSYKYDSYNVVKDKTYSIDKSDVQICFKDSNGNYICGYNSKIGVVYKAPSNCIMYVSYPKTDCVGVYNGKSSNATIKEKCLLKTKNTIYVGIGGDIQKFTEALKQARKTENTGKTFIVMPQTFDIVNELGEEYFANYSGYEDSNDMNLGNNITWIFSPGSKIVCNYSGQNNNVNTYFSPLNSLYEASGNFILDGLNLEASGTRYAIHDDNSTKTDFERHIYKNCTIKHNMRCIGAGFSKNLHVEILNCYFDNSSSAVHDASVSWHNCKTESKNKLIVSGCVFIGDSNTLLLSSYGEYDTETTVLVSNNLLQKEVELNKINSVSHDNIKLIKWNNAVKTT